MKPIRLLITLFFLVSGATAAAQPVDPTLIAEICDRVSSPSFLSELEGGPQLSKPPDRYVQNQAYQYANYRGVAVPLPANESRWTFGFSDSLAALTAIDAGVTYLFSESGEIADEEMLALWVPGPEWPRPRLTGISLLRRAASIQPDQWRCRTDSAQNFVDDVTALIAKKLAFRGYTTLYDFRDGLLAHKVRGNEESWRYVFEASSGKTMWIQIDVRDRALLRGIGHALAEPVGFFFAPEPSWLPDFFVAIHEPSRATFVALRESVRGFDLSETSMDSLDRVIEESSK